MKLEKGELRELKGIVDNLTKDLTDHSIKLQEEYEAKKTKLEEQFSKQESNLDARSNELDERAQALDDRESKHVRREIYKNFLVKLSERLKDFNVSKATSNKGLVVVLTLTVLMAVTGMMVIYTFTQMALGVADIHDRSGPRILDTVLSEISTGS